MFEYIIWLEVHIKLATQHKIFCHCHNTQDFENTVPNTHICPTCTAQPGWLPIINPECIETAIKLGTLFGSNLNQKFTRDRKSYFYPDSPSGFQITQFHNPIITGGVLNFFTDHFQTPQSIHIHEAHLENDTAKTITINGTTFIDFNRSGGPLIEIVTQPEFTNEDQVIEFLKELQRIVRWNNIGFADLEKGQMRVDVNLSIRKQGETTLGTRVEVKNINSFSSIRKAIQHEFQRHQDILSNGRTVDQETRGWDDIAGKTYILRSKENAHDYRYFQEQDLPLINPDQFDWSPNFQMRSGFGKIKQFIEYGFQKEYIHGLLNNELLFEWFESAVEERLDPKLSAKWLLGSIANKFNEGGESALHINKNQFIEFLHKISQNKINDNICKKIMEELLEWGTNIDDLITKNTSVSIDKNEIGNYDWTNYARKYKSLWWL
jgi:aspartyl-tRNA(Asn)/glutamyl-tRNA(Gln) amidotransferase subunit B